MSDDKISGIYVELDALFDTRLACLAKYDDVTLAKALINYTDRKIDDFTGVEYSLFKRDYDNRTKLILKDAGITNTLFFINDFIKKTIKLNYATPHKLKPKVIVNTYPYLLSKDETSVIVDSVFLIGDQLADVEVVHMSYEELTPSYLNSQISIMLVYEYYKWLEAQSLNNNLRKTSCPEVTMISPKIYFKPNTDNVDGDPFAAMEELARPFINLKLMPIGLFCHVSLTT